MIDMAARDLRHEAKTTMMTVTDLKNAARVSQMTGVEEMTLETAKNTIIRDDFETDTGKAILLATATTGIRIVALTGIHTRIQMEATATKIIMSTKKESPERLARSYSLNGYPKDYRSYSESESNLADSSDEKEITKERKLKFKRNMICCSHPG